MANELSTIIGKGEAFIEGLFSKVKKDESVALKVWNALEGLEPAAKAALMMGLQDIEAVGAATSVAAGATLAVTLEPDFVLAVTKLVNLVKSLDIKL